MKPVFFRSAADLGKWFETHHATVQELWVGYYKKGSGKPSLTWPESVDQALCVGWIDAVRKRIDDVAYQIRFCRRKQDSIWSSINIAKVRALTAQGRMRPAGLEVLPGAGQQVVLEENDRPEIDAGSREAGRFEIA